MWGGTANGKLNIYTYNMQTNTKKTPYVTNCVQNAALTQGSCVHGITQTADNNVIIDFANDRTCLECGNRLWNGDTLVHLQDATNHMDTGLDLNGKPIFIGMGNPSTLAAMKNPCPGGWGLDVRQQNDFSSAYCLLDKQPAWHVSYRGRASQPWAAISFFDDRASSEIIRPHVENTEVRVAKDQLLCRDLSCQKFMETWIIQGRRFD